jgi:hypothetical protein
VEVDGAGNAALLWRGRLRRRSMLRQRRRGRPRPDRGLLLLLPARERHRPLRPRDGPPPCRPCPSRSPSRARERRSPSSSTRLPKNFIAGKTTGSAAENVHRRHAVRGQPLKRFLAQQLLADHLVDQRLGVLPCRHGHTAFAWPYSSCAESVSVDALSRQLLYRWFMPTAAVVSISSPSSSAAANPSLVATMYLS